jgi:ribosomal protein L11 methyltransferase
LKGITPAPGGVSLRCSEEDDWAESWLFDFEPLTIGTRLFVCAPWVDERPPDRIAVVIKPGMAFGTGQHATTRMCLELAEDIALGRPLSSAVDLGCGSGVLAIALAMLGVPRVLAVDSDPLALEATSYNAEENGVGAAVATATELPQLSGSTDLMVANLFISLLAELAPAMVAQLAPGGALVCSGVVESDGARLEQIFADAGLCLRERRNEKPWVALVFDRPSVN